MDSLLQQLQDNSQDMNECFLTYGTSMDRFGATVEVCEANVRALRRRLGWQRSWFCRSVLHSMHQYRRERDENSAREIYNRLQRVVQEVAHRAEEVRISGS